MMFKFESDEKESGKARKRRFINELIEYGFSLYDSRQKIADYCGFNVSHLNKLIRERDELKMFRIKKDSRYLIKYGHYTNEELWKKKN